ncbi:MAG: hypothetical protein KGJ87_07270 [Planctomycetota bacterium]|nr:hypothetical protein [Planctomycetota bacterium]MDE1890155.1 hypothetical protein [Planctomycetota bacterium]MDE2216940.1 hypothetical protein [Planctomycetota bacterium]
MAARSEAEAIHGFLPEAPAFRLGSGSLYVFVWDVLLREMVALIFRAQ